MIVRQLALDGYCSGPLFAPPAKRRPPKRKARGWRWYKARNAAATPAWATAWKIALIYARARMLGQSVDHIVPLGHPLVCGLHVEHNLRVIPVQENTAKGNRWWPDMPEQQMELELC